jgi:hypothetical protein
MDLILPVKNQQSPPEKSQCVMSFGCCHADLYNSKFLLETKVCKCLLCALDYEMGEIAHSYFIRKDLL